VVTTNPDTRTPGHPDRFKMERQLTFPESRSERMQRILSGDVSRYCRPAAVYFSDDVAHEAERRAAEIDLGLAGIIDTELDPGECGQLGDGQGDA
jgi:hypothetical protein